jgi:hypothetical protein
MAKISLRKTKRGVVEVEVNELGIAQKKAPTGSEGHSEGSPLLAHVLWAVDGTKATQPHLG